VTAKTPCTAAAAARYLFTTLTAPAVALFRKADAPLLHYLEEEGGSIEPDVFVPVVPLVLLNGVSGITTGFSTSVPNYALEDVCANVRRMMAEKEPTKMTPSWNGFKGTVEELESGVDYLVSGVWEADGSKLSIRELPIGMSIDGYKHFLEGAGLGIHYYENNCSDTLVSFDVYFEPGKLEALPDSILAREMHLTKRVSTANMHLFDCNNHIRRFEGTADMLREHFDVRLALYDSRLLYQIRAKEEELGVCRVRANFIKHVMGGRIVIMRKDKRDIKAVMTGLGIAGPDQDRLLALPLTSLTQNEIDHLTRLENSLAEQLKIIKTTSSRALWEEDIEALLKAANK
jgi:DNA topoisomerase-2